MTIELNMPPGEQRREVHERARFFQRVHDLREPLAYAVAIAQLGAAVPKRLGATSGTVAGYLDEVEERFGEQAVTPKQKKHRTGPLDEGTIPVLTDPEGNVDPGPGIEVDDETRRILEEQVAERQSATVVPNESGGGR